MPSSKFSRNSLVIGHLENLSREMLADSNYRKILNGYVQGQCGIYALYMDERLKYVGLAANLPGRLAAHLRDRHSDSWNRFSVYITHDDEHMKELESLILRIWQPKENRTSGKLQGSENLERKIKNDLTRYYQELHRDLFGSKRKKAKAGAAPAPKPKEKLSRESKLAGYFTRPTRIRLKYKDTIYEAMVHKDGTIQYGAAIFTSPSIAGARIIGRRSLNGWKAWEFKNKDGQWVLLDTLRKKSKRT
ncbi:MAG: hypothetical protein GX444_17555 [Myxococcales bacterium]|nr:hypothetical protein [Myxococcales bacterium]